MAPTLLLTLSYALQAEHDSAHPQTALLDRAACCRNQARQGVYDQVVGQLSEVGCSAYVVIRALCFGIWAAGRVGWPRQG